MANQNPVTYQRPVQRDWSAEITSLPGRSVTGKGGTRSGGSGGTHAMAGNGTHAVTENGTHAMAGNGTSRAPSNTGLGGMEREAQAGAGTGNGGTWNHAGGMRMETADQAAAEWMRTLPAMTETPADSAPSNNMPDRWADVIGAEIENHLPDDMIEAPTTLEEVYRGSMKSLLLRNLGNYVVATFLIGTQGTVSWEGILYNVGNDYVAIYQSGRDQYIVCDLYSLKYVEFYDTQRRALCDSVLAEREENDLRS